MNCRFVNAGKQWALVAFILLGVLLAACGGGGGGAASSPGTAPAAPSSLQATATSSTAIILNWVDGSSNEAGFKVYQGADSTTVTTLVATVGAGTTSYSHTGLTASTAYYYKIIAYNSAGDSDASNVANATTPTLPPAVPATLQASAVSSTRINLTWTDASTNEDGFKVYQGPDSSNVTTLLATLGAGTTSHSDTGLTASTNYYYKVAAFNAGGESAASNIDNATTLPPPVTVPAAPTNLQATVVSSNVVTLTWDDNSTDEAGFRVYRGPTFTPQIGADLGEGVRAFTDTTAPASTTFVYQVQSFNSAGPSLPATSNAVTTPAPPPPPLLPTSVDGGNRHSLALMSDGTVRAWGTNDNGALGVGSSVPNSLTPIPVMSLTGVSAISAGDGHSLVLMSNGTVKGWGQNFFGAVGSGDNVVHYTPVDVFGLTGVSAISAGGFFSVALKTDGTVWSWGSGLYGQIGDGTLDIPRYSPVRVAGLTGMTAISAQQNHSLALKSDGTVWAWGLNDSGQLGDGTTTNRLVPFQVVGLTGKIVVAVSAGQFHSLALLSDGTVRAWGGNVSGELGNGTQTDSVTPVTVSGLDNVSAIAAGGSFSVALKNDGTVWSWGSGTYGQLGDGRTTTTNQLTPVQVKGLNGVGVLDNVSLISAAKDHSLSLRNGATVWGWGRNTDGQIGDNSTTDRVTPVLTSGF
jgi:alpha-tubulin suppressor-like RCC1 family protein